MSRFYNDTITNLFLAPQHVGTLEQPTYSTTAGTPGQSDVLQVQLVIKNNLIEQVRFRAHGKVTTIAVGEYLCTLLENNTVEQLHSLTYQKIIEALQLPSTQYQSAALGQQAIDDLVAQQKSTM